jgi:hypothetical protein
VTTPPSVLTEGDPTNHPQQLGLDVVGWRFEELERAGYPTHLAITLAERGDVDLHVACALLGAGATPHQALRILT